MLSKTQLRKLLTVPAIVRKIAAAWAKVEDRLAKKRKVSVATVRRMRKLLKALA